MKIALLTVSKYVHSLLVKRVKKVLNDNVRYVALAYKVHGDTTFYQTPIIVLHGLLGSKKNWESMSKRINDSTSMSVIAVDARNHGESPHESTHSYKDLASDVRELLVKLSIKEALVLGHSMGGRTAMVLALMEVIFTFISPVLNVDYITYNTTIVLNLSSVFSSPN